MKHRPWLSYLLLFSVFFPIGYWTGSQISPAKRNSTLTYPLLNTLAKVSASTNIGAPNFEYPALDQRSLPNSEAAQTNLLLLFVDDLGTEKSVLNSMWLIVQPQDSSRLIFLPVFQENNPIQDLSSTFQVERGNLNPRFIKAIQKREILWHSSILLDQTAQKKVMELMEQPLGEELPSSLEFLTIVCEKMPLYPHLFHELTKLIPEHLTADFDLKLSLDLWQFRSAGHLPFVCEFPTLLP